MPVSIPFIQVCNTSVPEVLRENTFATNKLGELFRPFWESISPLALYIPAEMVSQPGSLPGELSRASFIGTRAIAAWAIDDGRFYTCLTCSTHLSKIFLRCFHELIKFEPLS